MPTASKWWLIAIAILSLSVPGLADGPVTGTIDGRVLDAEREPLPGVMVTLSGARGQKSVVSDEGGEFRFGLLPAGDYTVETALEGLGRSEVSVSLETGARRTLELTLRAGTEEMITVSAGAALVDKYAIGTSASLETDVSENLSFNARNYQSSIEALPGVVHDNRSRVQGDHKYAVNGGQDTEAAGMVDGIDTSFSRFNGSGRMFLPTTALEEVQLESAGFSVEFGRVVGGVTNAVVKSGTNQFHGQLLYIPQSESWRAPYDAFDLDRKSSIISSFEANLGGPIVRDKAWFFAGYAEQDTNSVDVLGTTGETLSTGLRNEVPMLKLNFQPNERHQLTALGIDSPVETVVIVPVAGDEFGPCACDIPGDMATASWGYAVSPSSYLELRVADQRNDVLRESLRQRAIDPAAAPENPLANNFSYVDVGPRLFYNTIAAPAGEGYFKIPRRQGNASMSLFRGRNEIKFGVDYQDIEMESISFIGRRFTGVGFNTSRPGGFQVPRFMDVYDPASPITTTTEVATVYVQDRLDASDRWNIYAGLRLDDQSAENDLGEEAVSWTKIAPRLGVVYDVEGSGRLLLKASAGRYYQIVNQDLVNDEFARLPSGANLFDRFLWNPATQRYDRFDRRVVPALDTAIQEVDPYYKDELTLGTQWQFSDTWVFEAQAIWWELSDLFWASDQFDAEGGVRRDVRNWDEGFRDYIGLRLELNRAFRGGWTLRTNYTLGENEGNNFGANDNVSTHDDDLFEGLGGVEVGTGATDATSVFRDGRGFLDRTHNLNIVGLKQFSAGAHVFALGGYFLFRSGEPWGLRESTVVAHPVSGQTITTTSYREPRDAQQLEDTFSLNLTGSWNFPIGGRLQGRVAIEVANLTDEQELIGINRANGLPIPGTAAFQAPREFRGQVGVQF